MIDIEIKKNLSCKFQPVLCTDDIKTTTLDDVKQHHSDIIKQHSAHNFLVCTQWHCPFFCAELDE